MTLVRRGSFEKAAELFAGSLAIAHELDLEMPVGFNQSMLARTDRAAGRLEDARVRLAESLQILSGSGYAAYTIRARKLFERTGAGSDEGLKSAAAVDFTGLLDEVRL